MADRLRTRLTGSCALGALIAHATLAAPAMATEIVDQTGVALSSTVDDLRVVRSSVYVVDDTVTIGGDATFSDDSRLRTYNFGCGTDTRLSGGAFTFIDSDAVIEDTVLFGVGGDLTLRDGDGALDTIGIRNSTASVSGTVRTQGNGRIDIYDSASVSAAGLDIGSGGLLQVFQDGSLTLSGAATNAGTTEISGGTLNANGALTNTGLLGIGRQTTVDVGESTYSGGSGSVSVDGPFLNTGTVEVANGSLYLYGGSSISGTTTVGGSGLLDFSGSGHAVTGGSLTVAADGQATFSDRLDLTGGRTEIGGTLQGSASGSVLAVGGGSGEAVLVVLSGGTAQAGTILVRDGGTVGGVGSFLADFLVESGGRLAAGSSPGTMVISGDLTLGGTLEVEIADPGTFDFYSVQGTANLTGGQILFVPLGGYQFSASDSIQFLQAQGGILGVDSVSTVLQSDPGQLIDLAISPSDPTVLIATLGPTKQSVQAPVVEETAVQRNRPVIRSIQNSVGFRMRQLQRLGGVGLLGDTGILQRLGGGANDGDREDSALPAGLTGLSGGDEALLPGALWADASRTYLDSSRPGLGYDGFTDTVLLGADRFLGDGVLVGGTLGYERTRLSLDSPTGNRDSDGVAGTVYGGLIIDDTFWVDALVSYARLDNEIDQTRNGTAITGDFASHRLTTALNLNAQHSIDAVTLAGTIGYSWTREAFEAYQAGGGGLIDPDTVYLGTARATLEAAWAIGEVEPFASASWEVDAVNSADGDRNGAVLAAGLRAAPWAGWSLGVSANAQVGREDEESWSVAGNLRVEF